MDQASLAKAASISRNTLISFENGNSIPNRNNLAAIIRVLEEAGVEFIPENGGGPGVRERKTAADRG